MKALLRLILCCKHSSAEPALHDSDQCKDLSLEDSALQAAVSVPVPPSESPEPEPKLPPTPREELESTKEVEEVRVEQKKQKKHSKTKKMSENSVDLGKKDSDLHSGRHVPLPRDAKPRKSILKQRR
jgi:hypothetical protein